MMRAARRILTLLAAAFLLSSGASGYYFYVHFASRFAPFNPIPSKFDLNSLRNKTVYYFISDAGPSQFAGGDSFTALISQVRLAAKTWNDVESSDLRLAFGGLTSLGTPQNSPGIDVVFDDDIPPGVAALGGPTMCVPNPNGAGCAVVGATPFVSIQRSTLRVRRDLRDSPSFGESAFMTLVHEFGHTLGLQHTFTSSTMSTDITRATTKSHPLTADDTAGISVLYPTGSFLANSGSVSGRVTMGGAGVNLASVVAIAVNGPAVSTLTNPDGTYTIQGLPPGQSYLLYVHPLPPAAAAESKPGSLEPPTDQDGLPLRPEPGFDTVFFPGVKDPNQATPFYIGQSDARNGIDFTVTRRNAPAISSVTTYLYYGDTPVHPAPLLNSGPAKSIVAAGNGLVNGNSPVPALSVTVLGSAGANTVGTPKYFRDGYIYFGLAPTFGNNSGARHLVFSANNDIYVLPSAFILVPGLPPTISSLTPGTDGNGAKILQISGSNFDSNTRILFDGVPGANLRQNGDGSLTVTPPPGNAGYRASVVALNFDGQSSLFLQPVPQSYLYDSGDAPFYGMSPSALPAGSEAMVEVTGTNTTFLDGQTSLGFGSSDVTVRRVWVTGPNRVLANVSVNPSAPPTASDTTVASGLQLATQPFGFQILSANPRQVVLTPPATGAPAGGTAVAGISNFTGNAASVALTVGDQRATVLSISGGQITFQVAAGLPQGPAVIRLQLPTGDPVFAVVMNIEAPPPSITQAFGSPGVAADAAHPAFRGSLIGFSVTGLPESSVLGDLSAIRINIGGFDHTVVSANGQPGGALLQVLLNPSVTTGNQVPVTVTYNGGTSQPFLIPVR